MTRKELKKQVKEEQKKTAELIKILKPARKPSVYHADSELYDAIRKEHGYCSSLQWEYRHRHIMYCYYFNNTPYDAIEQPATNHRPDAMYLDKIKEEWENCVEVKDEDLCISA